MPFVECDEKELTDLFAGVKALVQGVKDYNGLLDKAYLSEVMLHINFFTPDKRNTWTLFLYL